MGLDITVLVVDWDHLARTPAAERLGMLEDAAYPDDDCDDRDSGGGGTEAPVEHGWVRRPDTPWCALYEFFRTLGSFKPHFWAYQAWEDVRDFAEPDLRAALDAFLAGLFWLGPDDAAADTSAEDEPASPDSSPANRTRGALGCSSSVHRSRSRTWRARGPLSPPSSKTSALRTRFTRRDPGDG